MNAVSLKRKAPGSYGRGLFCFSSIRAYCTTNRSL